MLALLLRLLLPLVSLGLTASQRPAAGGQPPAHPEAPAPLTVAERSDYRATSRHADVLAFCQELAKKSPHVKYSVLGKSGQGRELPLLVIADPPVDSPEAAARSGKPVLFVIGNIHAGEVDGKEGLLMLARDLVTAEREPLLKELVFVFAPIFNADGNELIDRNNRVSQNGPIDGVGQRANSQGLDLNRDFVKLESPEVRALVRALNRWNPAVFIDLHTTNGSQHGYTLTYDGPRHPASSPALLKTVRDRLLPEVGNEMRQKDGYPTFFYGNFSRDHKSWEMYSADPRYGIQYVGLRGRIGILSESYSYAPFRDRVLASRAFVRHIAEWTAGHGKELKKLLDEAEQPRDKVAIRGRTSPLPGEWKVRGFAEEQRDGRRVVTGRPVDYAVTFYGQVEPTLTVSRPYAYLVPPQYRSAIETLQRHGLQMEELREDIELDVETYKVDRVRKQANSFHGPTVVVDATPRTGPQLVKAGSVLVRTQQPLGTLAVLLLEPGTEDGLVTWRFFDDGLAEGKDFPVLRVLERQAMLTGKPRDLPEDRKKDLPLPENAFFGGNTVNVSGWVDDEHYLMVRDGRLLKVQARTGRATPFVDTEKLAKSLGAAKGMDRDTARRLTRGPMYRFDPKRTAVLIENGGDLFLAYLDGSPGVKLTSSRGPREYLSFSPDGRHLAWVRGNNLWTVDATTQTERQLTKDGGTRVFNAKGDWVYEEEVFNRNGRAYWWSPDSQRICYFHLDDAPVKPFKILDVLQTHPREELIDYPKAGDPNPHAKLGVVSVSGGEPVFPELGDYKPAEFILIRGGFMSDSKQVYLYVANRTQTWLDICTAPASGGPFKRLFRETTKAWIDDPGELTFLPDGTFLFESERTGWKHLYHYDHVGQLLGPVTQGEWEVKTLHAHDQKGGWLYFSAVKDAPLGQNLYRCRLDGSGFERLTPGPGDHRASVSPSGNLFIDSHSDPETPPQVHLYAGTGGPALRTLDSNPVYEREQYKPALSERVQIKTTDGFLLEGVVTRPSDFDPKKKYPVWVQIYGGPRMPTIRDSYGVRSGDQRLAGQGFFIFRVDPRSGSGKGACSAWTAFKQLGVQETKDLDEAVDWLCQKYPQADAKRIGISGHSYGGYLTAFVLTHSTKFAAGAAGAPVTDWRNYDSIYTERYMLTPKENPDGYDKSSVVKAARNLHGKLLLMHGLMDDNVHAQNTVQLIDALQRAGKDYELLVFPRARHGFGAQRQILDFMKRTLGGPE